MASSMALDTFGSSSRVVLEVVSTAAAAIDAAASIESTRAIPDVDGDGVSSFRAPSLSNLAVYILIKSLTSESIYFVSLLPPSTNLI